MLRGKENNLSSCLNVDEQVKCRLDLPVSSLASILSNFSVKQCADSGVDVIDISTVCCNTFAGLHATGARVQTTVNNLDVKVLGTCARFEEKQVRIVAFNLHCLMLMPSLQSLCNGRWLHVTS